MWTAGGRAIQTSQDLGCSNQTVSFMDGESEGRLKSGRITGLGQSTGCACQAGPEHYICMERAEKGQVDTKDTQGGGSYRG